MADSAAAAALAAPMAGPASPVPIDEASCGPGRANCGFRAGITALLADARTNGEWFTVASVTMGGLDHLPGALTAAYAPSDGARLTDVEVRALYHDARRRQLRLLGPGLNLVLMDGIAGFEIRWLGDPRPPRGPVPPAGQTSCLVDAEGGLRLPARDSTDGPWSVLAVADFTDGPWCGREPWRFDADLYRVRLLTLRIVFEAPAAAGGPMAPATFSAEITLAPPNLRRMS
jgi:hypothetical protein